MVKLFYTTCISEYFTHCEILRVEARVVLVPKSRMLANLRKGMVLIDYSLTVKAATLIFISGRGSPILSANEGKSGFIYNLVKS